VLQCPRHEATRTTGGTLEPGEVGNHRPTLRQLVDRHRLELAIAAQEGLRGILPDEVIDAAVTTLRQQLAAVGEPARRRQVTVLFADVSAFTALSERLDHEVLADLMNELWGRLDTVITELGGLAVGATLELDDVVDGLLNGG